MILDIYIYYTYDLIPGMLFGNDMLALYNTEYGSRYLICRVVYSTFHGSYAK
jgi:hypothetical protein